MCVYVRRGGREVANPEGPRVWWLLFAQLRSVGSILGLLQPVGILGGGGGIGRVEEG